MADFITRVAIRYRDVGVVSLPKPARHGDIIFARHHVDRHVTSGLEEQGFVTNHKSFVDRKEGLRIALAAGQVKHKTGNTSGQNMELYSEDMW